MPTSGPLEPFIIRIGDAQLDDLRRRLENARWPAEITGAGWDYGTDAIQDRDGHFAAFEQPRLFAADLDAYGEILRDRGLCSSSVG